MRRTDNARPAYPIVAVLALMGMFFLAAPLASASASGPTTSATATPGLEVETVVFRCAMCASSITGGGSSYGASWNMDGRPCEDAEQPGCAECTPSCVGSGSIGGTWSEVSAWYDENSCENNQCQGLGLELAALDGRDAHELAKLIQTSPGRVQFNRDRQAVQIFGCQPGVVSRHVALTSGEASALDAAIAVLSTSF